MKYELVELEEKLVVGLSSRTSNHDPKMPEIIGGLWNDYYQKGVYQGIKNKANGKSICLYSDFESDLNGKYDATICCEVDCEDEKENSLVVKKIQAGKYAKFVVKGHMQRAVVEFWMKFWQMDFDRSYTTDFEEYQGGSDMDNTEIHIYVALN